MLNIAKNTTQANTKGNITLTIFKKHSNLLNK